MVASVSDMESNYSASDALRDVATSRRTSAARVVTPWWYHPALGAAEAAIIVGLAVLPRSVWTWVLFVLAFAVIGAIVTAYRTMTGVWVAPENAGRRSRPLWVASGVAITACLVLAAVAGLLGWPTWVGWVDALVAFVAVVVLGRAFDNALRADIAAGDANL